LAPGGGWRSAFLSALLQAELRSVVTGRHLMLRLVGPAIHRRRPPTTGKLSDSLTIGLRPKVAVDKSGCAEAYPLRRLPDRALAR